MTLLLDHDGLARRQRVARGGLQPLTLSLSADLQQLLTADEIFFPTEKARLSRRGGRCESDGTQLEFDPFSPHLHRCAKCGREYAGEEHYRWWVMGYQLWLAERAVHAAVLHAVSGDPAHARLSRAILDGYASRYLRYPNRDNVLGPSRLFFSTYLESIWLLQIAIALDLLESVGEAGALGDRLRETIIVPAVALIAQYDEGLSNRQVWNNAALFAAATLIEEPSLADAAIFGQHGLVTHLAQSLLADGTWYEGENYHLFAHRGLWYSVAMAERRGETLPGELVRRFDEGFATPFVTALPDFAFPARRDSQYAVSLRQWRTAESCELGVARCPDDRRLRAALCELYRDDVPLGDSARARSTAEAERNVAASRLSRADLGWKSLLYARELLPPLADATPSSALLERQGFGIIRREAGRVYVALDYGTSGGGHGHPDRLNLWLVDGAERILEDVGTGSYVDPSLHWYRSTLAHNAPLVNGESQQRVDGRLLAYDDRGAAGWISSAASIAADVDARRTIVVMPDYLVDELTWISSRDITLDLPIHLDAEIEGTMEWESATLSGAGGEEDGFDHLRNVERAKASGSALLSARAGATSLRGWVSGDVATWYRAEAPGPPGSDAPRRLFIARSAARSGTIRTVLDWRGNVEAVSPDVDALRVHLKEDRHEHSRDGALWHIALFSNGARSSIDLGPSAEWPSPQPSVDARGLPDETVPVAGMRTPANARVHRQVPRSWALSERVGDLTRWGESWMWVTTLGAGRGSGPLVFDLRDAHYRRSEETWEVAGKPWALVSVAVSDDELAIEILSQAERNFAPRRDGNPLDNEHPDINSDGVQLYLASVAPCEPRGYSWLLVPEVDSDRVRVAERMREGPAITPTARWKTEKGGYMLLVRIPLEAIGGNSAREFLLQVVVNLLASGRERRSGQLVLSGAAGEWIYLRGDRENHASYLHLTLSE